MDPLAATLDGVAGHRAAALPFALLAGLATSVGPCVAPRYLALAALIGGRRSLVPAVAFAGGVVVVTVAIGAGTGLVAGLVANRTALDLILAGGLIAFGLATLVREPHACGAPAHPGGARASGAFTLGGASALVVSPCCTPVLVAVAGLGAAARDPLFGLAVVAAFAAGHALPLLAAGLAGSWFGTALHRLTATAAPAVVSGSLTIALGAYYGLLA